MYIYILYFALILLHLYLIILLLKKSRENKSLWALIVFNISIIFWITLSWAILEYYNQEFVLWIVRGTYVATAVSIASYVVFIRYSVIKKIDWQAIIVLILFVLMVPFAFTDYLVKSITITDASQFVPVNFGSLSPIFIAYFVIAISILLISVSKGRRESKGLELLRLRYITTSMIIAGAVALFTNVIYSLITGLSSLATLGPVAISIVSILTTYSYLKNRLFSLRFLIGRLFYFVLLSIIPLCFILGITILSVKVPQMDIKNTDFILLIILISVSFAALFVGFHNWMEKKIFPKLAFGQYDPEEAKEKFTRAISTKLDINELGDEVVYTLSKVFSLEKLGILIFNEERTEIMYKNVKNIEISDFPIQDLLLSMSERVGKGLGDTLARDEIAEENTEDAHLQKLLQFMNNTGLQMILPINKRVQLSGVILLGRKASELSYTTEEISLLESLAMNASVAFGRSLLYQEVETFNQTLQQKVDLQTKELQVKVQELQEARRKENDMIDIMGHELRTPATVVKLNAQLLDKFTKDIESDPEAYKRYVGRIKIAVENEIKLINTLLSSAKLEGDKVVIEPEEIDTRNEIEMAINGNEREAQEKRLPIINNTDPNTPHIYADKARVVEILNNLLSNAVKYTESGSVMVESRFDDERVEISVIDTGRGISQEDLPKLGNKFYRAGNYIESSKDDPVDIVRPGGTGLGLFVTFNLIRKMGGEIHVESEIGKGSKFMFTLPRYKGQNDGFHKSQSSNMFEKLGLKKT